MALCMDPAKGLFLQGGAALDSCYTGQTCSGKRHGSGSFSYANRFFSYQGDYKEGRKHGHGKFMMGDGGCYEGQFVNDEIQGTGTRRFANGNVYTGDFVLGHMHGTGTLYQANGDVYEGTFEHSHFEGDGVYTFADGSRYEGQLQGHKFHGWGQMTYSDGNRYEGQWRSGVRSGHGECSYSNGNHYKGDWQDNQPHNEGVLSLAGHGIQYRGHGFKAGAPEHVAAKLNALYLADDPASRPDKARNVSKAGGKEPSAGAKDGSAELAPLQVLPGQPFPVSVTVAAQAEAPFSPQQPRASDSGSNATASDTSLSASTGPQAASGTAQQATGSNRPPSAASARLAGSAQQTPRRCLVTAAAPRPGMQWVTADMEFGRTVHMTLHREAPQPLPEGRLLSALLCVTAVEAEAVSAEDPECCQRVRLLIVTGVSLDPPQPLDLLSNGTAITMRSMQLEAGQYVLQPQELVLGRSRPDGSLLLDGGSYCLVFSSCGVATGHLQVVLPAGAPAKKGAVPVAVKK